MDNKRAGDADSLRIDNFYNQILKQIIHFTQFSIP